MLRLRLLGRPQITLDDKPVTDFAYRASLALLCHLAVAGRPHSREVLAGLFWGERPDANARASLRKSLTDLRRSVGDFLVVTRQTVAFDRKRPHWLDVAEFSFRVDDALQQRGGRLTRERATSLQRAVKLYRGDFLEGFLLRQAPAFEEWVLGQRERLRYLALQALYLLSMYCTEQGEYGSGIEYASLLLTMEPWQEEAHRQMMLLLALDGQRSAALRQYENCCRVLEEELGVEPVTETTRLYERIVAGEIVPPPALRPAPLPPTTPRHNLPAQLTTFVGRKEEIAEISRRLLHPDYRLVTLVGTGGVGKTRLALQSARQQVAAFGNGVTFVPLAEVASPDLVATAIANALDLTFARGDDPDEQLYDFLRHREMLLILDGFEHLLAGAGLIMDILRNAPYVTVLVTSRERLNFQAELAIGIQGLPVPKTGRDPTAATYSSVQLFTERAGRTAKGFMLTKQALPHVIRVCQFVDGLPLGIELAAGWIEQMRPAEIAQSIQQNLDFLATNLRDVPQRHRSIDALFEGSWQLLSPTEQAILARASVFRGGFTQEAAVTVSGATPSDLAALVRKSLLHRTASGRHQIHGLLRRFAAVKLGGMGEIPEVGDLARTTQRRHSGFYLRFVVRRQGALGGKGSQRAVAEIRSEMENVRQAWRWAAAHARLETIHNCIDGLSSFFCHTGQLEEGARALSTAATRMRMLSQEQRPREEKTLALVILGKLLIEQARCMNERGMYDQTIALGQELVQLARETRATAEGLPGAQTLGDDTLDEQTVTRQSDRFLAAGYQNWGWALARQGDVEEGESYLKQALNLAHEARFLRVEATCLDNLGSIRLEQGKTPNAAAYFEQALHVCQEAGDRQGEISALNHLGLIRLTQNDFAGARAHLSQVLVSCRRASAQRLEEAVLDNLGLVSLSLGDHESARRYLERSLKICREIGDQEGAGETLYRLGLLFHHLGDDETARRYSRQALQIGRQIGNHEIQAHAMTYLGQALAGLGQLDEAVKVYQAALDVRRANNQSRLTTTLLAGLARVALAQGDLPQAQAHVEEILASVQKRTPDSAEEPMRIYLTCYHVLKAAQDARAQEILATAHGLLQEWAAKIGDARLKQRFLENVATHREILGEFKSDRPPPHPQSGSEQQNAGLES